MRLEITTVQFDGSRSISASSSACTSGEATRCRSSKTITPCGASLPASALTSSATAARSPPSPSLSASCPASASGARRHGRSKGSSAAPSVANRRSASSSSSSATQASGAPRCIAAICVASAEVLPKPAGATSSTSRLLRSASRSAASSAGRAMRALRARGGWILVAASAVKSIAA